MYLPLVIFHFRYFLLLSLSLSLSLVVSFHLARTFCAEIFRNAPCPRSPPPTTRCPTLLPRRTGVFFLFYPARRRSDRWAINELKRPSFFLVSLWLSSFDALPPASPSPLHHPSYPSRSPPALPLHGRIFLSRSLFLSLELSLALSFSRARALFSPSPFLSHSLCLPFSLSPPVSLSCFSRRFHSLSLSFPLFCSLRSDLSISISHSLPFPSSFSSPLSSSSASTSSTSCGSRPFRSSSNSPFHGREKRTGSCPSRTLFHSTFLRLPSVGLSDPAASLSRSPHLPFSLSFSLSAVWTGHPSLSGFPRGSRARTRGHVRASHMHLHACRTRVSRSRIGR